MADDYTELIPIELITSPILLDKKTQLSSQRYILGYLVADYVIDQDATVVIYYRKDNDMVYKSLDPITLSKDKKRFYRKLPLRIGSVIDYYVTVNGSFKEFLFTTFKLRVKILPVGKRS